MNLTNKEALELIKMQNEISELGWQWKEHIFHKNDYRPECVIELSKSENPHVFSIHCGEVGYDPDKIGWGRFDRMYAWREAYKVIVINKEYK
jgi:hypothetical protein